MLKHYFRQNPQNVIDEGLFLTMSKTDFYIGKKLLEILENIDQNNQNYQLFSSMT